jgi:hypothetical protein
MTPPTLKTTGPLGCPGGQPKVQPLTKTYGKSAGMFWGQWDHFCDIWFQSVTSGHVVHVTPKTPKRLVDLEVLGACQRCSPLTQTYGKSAGMVWGLWDNLCYIWFLSVHMRLAPAVNSGSHFCGELVSARKNAWHSNFRHRWFLARFQSLLSLGAYLEACSWFGRRARTGQTAVFFATFIFAAPWRELTGGCEGGLLEPGNFWQGVEVCRVWAQSGLRYLHGERVKTVEQPEGFCCTKSAKSAPSLQSLHLAHLMHTL